MKKILSRVIAVASLIFASTAWSATTVEVVWPFNTASINGVMMRTMVDEANQAQSDYRFVLVSAPGAGGVVAVNKVANANGVAVLAHSNAFFVRAILYKNYSLDQWTALYPVCSESFVIASKKYKSINEIPVDAKVNIAVGGLGTLSHFTAELMKKRFVNLQVVPYKSGADATAAVVSNQIDLGIGFTSDLSALAANGDVNLIAITGNSTSTKIPLLKNVSGLSDVKDMVTNVALYIPADMDPVVAGKLQTILAGLTKNEKFANARNAACTEIPPTNAKEWYRQHAEFLKRETAGVKVELN
jgi:tripartite-type tricarboxylate transporter receptor subunit TctC